jgi:hypothetical protein
MKLDIRSLAAFMLASWMAFGGAVHAAGKAPAAAPDAVVEGVQMPAWLERDGWSQPLNPGMEIRNGDSVRTGGNSRVLLKMGEGSLVKLGENGILKFDNLGQRTNNLFTATLDVAAGAFRFTTNVLAKLRKREVNVKIATVTAGIRGTDLWGKAASDRDIVCLIEGRISVARGNDAPIDMKDPLSFYIAPRNAPPLPVAPVDPKQLAQWALETEIARGAGAVRRGGKWRVTLAVTDTEEDAFRIYDAVRAGGYPAELHPVGTPEKRQYQVRIGQLQGKSEAQALADTLKGRFGVTAPAVSG